MANNETRREAALRWLDENERHEDWLTERCARIAQGAPVSHCWRAYILRQSVFVEWLHRSPERLAQMATALTLARLGRRRRRGVLSLSPERMQQAAHAVALATIARWKEKEDRRRANRATWAQALRWWKEEDSHG